jgi:hypothetical protein
MLRIDGRHDAIAICLEGGHTTRPICSAASISNGVLYVGDRFLLRFTVANAAWEIGDESRGLRHRTPPTVR